MVDPLRNIDAEFDVSLNHDRETLRPVPNNVTEFKAANSKLEALLKDEILDARHKPRILSRCGIGNTILGDHSTGRKQLIAAHELVSPEDRLWHINRIRWATNYQFSKEFEVSNSMFDELILQEEKGTSLMATILQHAGKNQFDQRNFEKAKDLFLEALKIRRKTGDTELIESTELALQTTISKLNP